ncbi:hypothetical protein ABIE69_001143 [Rhodobacteraceae bacterium MBR-64]|jgi:hypothetical protein
MTTGFRAFIDRLTERRTRRRWQQASENAATVDLETLRSQRARARALHQPIQRFLHQAEGRLALPLIDSRAMLRPDGSDWVWRPELWRGPVSPPGRATVPSRTAFGSGATLFHDCQHSELNLRQVRNTRETDLAPFGVRLDVFGFDGTFLSLVIDLPGDMAGSVRRKHVVRTDISVTLEKPLEIFARLNVKHGPNVDQVVREFARDGGGEQMVEFDLAYTKVNEKRVEKVWVDLIFEDPRMNQILLHDVTFSRRPRAEI